jgi:hypothetical protein
MTGLKILAAAALLALASATTAWAGSTDCVIGGDQGPCQSVSAAVSPLDTQLADTWFQPVYVHQRALGCVQTPCTFGSKEYACTYYYTSEVKQCSTCCSLEAQTGKKPTK